MSENRDRVSRLAIQVLVMLLGLTRTSDIADDDLRDPTTANPRGRKYFSNLALATQPHFSRHPAGAPPLIRLARFPPRQYQ